MTTLRRLFKSMYDHYGVYENVFISTPQKDSMIVVSPVPGSTVCDYRGAGYAENIDATLEESSFTARRTNHRSPACRLFCSPRPSRTANRCRYSGASVRAG